MLKWSVVDLIRATIYFLLYQIPNALFTDDEMINQAVLTDSSWPDSTQNWTFITNHYRK